MPARIRETTRKLCEAEAEIKRLCETLPAGGRLTRDTKHELANALTLVVAFRSLLRDPTDDASLVDDAEAAIARAHEIVRGLQLELAA